MTRFRKRHYQDVATVLQDLRAYADNGASPVQVWEQARALFADRFKADSAAFKPELFKRACIPGANVRART